MSDCSEERNSPELNIIPEQKKCANENLKEFIKTFEAFPELWNTSHALYTNKTRRNSALDNLVNILKKNNPNANRNDARKKINILRSNYRKEIRKIMNSKRSGCGTNEIYQPTSCVFYALQFLHKSEQPANSKNQPNQILNKKEPQINTLSQATKISASSMVVDEEENIEQPTITLPSQSSIISPPPPPSKKHPVGSIAKQNERLNLACKYLESSIDSDNKVPSIAKVWSEKIMELDAKQILLAEMAINDILFAASLGSLNRHSVQINNKPCDESRSPVMSFNTLYNDQSTISFNNELNATNPLNHSMSLDNNSSPLPQIISIEDKNKKQLSSNFTE